jgi:hypothetical protein
MKRLALAIRRLLAQEALSWAVTFTPKQDHETFVAFHALLVAMEDDAERTQAEFVGWQLRK